MSSLGNDIVQRYPSPAVYMVHVDVEIPFQSATYQIMNVERKQVMSVELTNKHTTIDISALSSGQYLFTYIIDNEQFSKKFLKH
jgi:hypothetical protein